MTVNLGAMVADLVLKDAEFNRNLERAGRNVNSFSSKSNRALARTERHWKDTTRAASTFSRQLKMLGGFALGAAGAAGIGALVKSSLEAADAIAKTADSIGVSTQALQKYQYIADRSGVSQQQLNGGLQAFSKRLGELRAGTGELNSRLSKNNTALRDQLKAAGDVSQALDIYMGHLQGVENQSDRNALASAAFSRTAGIAMTNMVNNIDTLSDRYNRLGIAIDEDMLRKTEAAKDSMDDLGLVIKNSFTAAVVALAPEMGAAADAIGRWVVNNKEFLTQDVPGHVRNMHTEIGTFVNSKEFDMIMEYWEIAAGAAVGFKYGAAVGRPGVGAILGAGAGAWISVLRDLDKLNTEQITQVEKLNQEYEQLGRVLEQIASGKGATDPARVKKSIADIEARRKEIEAEIKAIGQAAAAADDYSGTVDKVTTASGKATEGTKDLTVNTNELTEAMKKAREEQEAWEHEASIKAIQYAEEARQEYWQESIESMNAMVAREKEVYEQAQQDKTEAAQKAFDRQTRAQEEAMRTQKDNWERTWDDMHRYGAEMFVSPLEETLSDWETEENDTVCISTEQEKGMGLHGHYCSDPGREDLHPLQSQAA